MLIQNDVSNVLWSIATIEPDLKFTPIRAPILLGPNGRCITLVRVQALGLLPEAQLTGNDRYWLKP